MSANSWIKNIFETKPKKAETKIEKVEKNNTKVEEKPLVIKPVITIGRELGSGGRKVAKEVAKKLGYEYYDKEIITKAAKQSGIDSNLFKQVDESNLDSFWYEFSTKAYEKDIDKNSFKEMTMADKLFMIQSDIIRDVAKKGGCVILGRCATYILKNSSKRVFICADENDRIKRIKNSYKVGEKKAKEIIEISDKKRENYHSYYTNQDWKDKKGYDLVINTSEIGIEAAIEKIIELVKS